MLILPNTTAGAAELGDAIRSAFAVRAHPNGSSAFGIVTLSAGVAVWHPESDDRNCPDLRKWCRRKGANAEAVAVYRKAMLRATEDVENAIIALTQLELQSKDLTTEVDAHERASGSGDSNAIAILSQSCRMREEEHDRHRRGGMHLRDNGRDRRTPSLPLGGNADKGSLRSVWPDTVRR